MEEYGMTNTGIAHEELGLLRMTRSHTQISQFPRVKLGQGSQEG